MLFLQQMMDYVGAYGQKYSEIRLIDMNIDSKPTAKAIYIVSPVTISICCG